MSVTVAPVSSSKLLKVADLLGSFERNLILPVQQAPLVPPQLPQQAKRKFDDGKRVLVVRHGEGLHQIKGYVPKEGDLLGPDLTDAGKEQAREAKKRIVSELQRLGLSEESADLIVSSNLLRALHTALLLVPESFTSKVVVQPSLRERILDTRDEPSELEHLREWLMNSKYDEQVDLILYEEELIEAGSKATDFAMDLHDIYVRSCRSSDLKGDSWNAKQNKELLLERAARFTHWLEEHSCQVAIVVGHAVFLGMVTGDKDWFENGEVRSYALDQGYWKRLSKANSGKAAPSAAPNIGPGRLIPGTGAAGRGSPFARWSGVRQESRSVRPRGSLAIPRPS